MTENQHVHANIVSGSDIAGDLIQTTETADTETGAASINSVSSARIGGSLIQAGDIAGDLIL